MVHTLIILDTKRQVKKIVSRIEKLKENFIIICIDKEISEILKEKGIPHKTIDDYISSKDIGKKAFEWLNTLSEEKIDNKKSIKELMIYDDGVSLWNFIAPSLYGGFFYYPLADIIKYADLVSEVMDKEKPKRIIFVDDGGLLSDIIGSTLEKEDILKIKISDIKERAKEKIIKKAKRFLIMLTLCRTIIRKTYWVFLRFHEKTKTNNGAVLLFSGDQVQSFYDPTTKEKISGHPHCEYIFNALYRRGMSMTFVGVFVVVSILGLDIMKKRVSERDLRYVYRPFEGYITKKSILNVIKIIKRLTKKFKHEKNEFKKALNYRNISLHDIIYPLLLFYVSKYLINILIMYEAGRNMLKTECPSIVVTPESAVEVRCIASVAKKLNIPTLGIQHGVLSPNNPTYNTNDADMFPDITVVGGDYWKNIIANRSKCPSDQVLVAGIPRYDILAKADEIFDKENFFKEYKINPNHRIILWTTQCHSLSNEENIKNFKAVFGTMQNLKDVTLVIKQHGGEGKRYTKMIIKYLNDYTLNATVVPKDLDIYELLFVCDLVITKNSTTGMEAVALNKSVIVLNLSGMPDVINYVRDGVALGVYKEKDLKPMIEKLLQDDSELARNRVKYIEKNFYKIDSKATERVVKLIEEMINERQKRDEI